MCAQAYNISNVLPPVDQRRKLLNLELRLVNTYPYMQTISNCKGKGFEVRTCNISLDAPYLGASPNGKVTNPGCSGSFALIWTFEVKCPETKYLVTPLDV